MIFIIRKSTCKYTPTNWRSEMYFNYQPTKRISIYRSANIGEPRICTCSVCVHIMLYTLMCARAHSLIRNDRYGSTQYSPPKTEPASATCIALAFRTRWIILRDAFHCNERPKTEATYTIYSKLYNVHEWQRIMYALHKPSDAMLDATYLRLLSAYVCYVRYVLTHFDSANGKRAVEQCTHTHATLIGWL